MLKRLRIKFILINMGITTLMLCLIFSSLYLSTSRNLERESLQMMNRIALSPPHITPPNLSDGEIKLPYFSIHINRTSETIRTDGDLFDESDPGFLKEILTAALKTEAETGILKDYQLRFLRTESPFEQSYVFVDIRSEQATLHSLLKNFLPIGCAAFLVFLFISSLLARWAVRPVEKAWMQQKQFVADASHELKTPLTVIMTDAELLHTPECSDTERQQISGSILTMSEQMRGLVESLLELARMDNRSLNKQFELISLSEIVSNAAMMFEPIFFEKEMPFSYEIEPDLTLKGNGTHISQLIDIFLDNAAKYASPGGETLLTLQSISQRKYLLTVSNQGEPIPEEDLKNVFKRFYRADKARTRSHSYGLGLSIAESIVKEHHGRIWAESSNGYNRFYVELIK